MFLQVSIDYKSPSQKQSPILEAMYHITLLETAIIATHSVPLSTLNSLGFPLPFYIPLAFIAAIILKFLLSSYLNDTYSELIEISRHALTSMV